MRIQTYGKANTITRIRRILAKSFAKPKFITLGVPIAGLDENPEEQ